MKKTIKTTKKQFKPDYTLDFSQIENYNDLIISLISNRVKAGKTIDISDLLAYAAACMNFTLSHTRTYIICACEKEFWYKKLWKKIKGFFKK